MSITRVYCPAEIVVGESISLDKATSHHLTTVLRVKPGQPVCLFNGDGHDYLGHIESTGKTTRANIEEKLANLSESPLDTCLLQGLSRGDRMDFTLQKSVELGVSRVVVFHAIRSGKRLDELRQQKKHKHWEGVVRRAVQQSGRSVLPRVEFAADIAAALSLVPTDASSRWLLLPGSTESLATRVMSAGNRKQATLLIGPESGLDDEEIESARSIGFEAVSLGPRILRTETAAVAALSVLQTVAGDLA